MPQQLQMSPTLPEAQSAPRPSREREVRVQADAGAFGMLLGALQGGEAGIVRGEARNDSAAEWNAQDAREGRQESRDRAQASTPRAQEPREVLERLVGAGRQQSAHATPARVEVAQAPAASEPRGPANTRMGATGGQESAKQAEQGSTPAANLVGARSQAVAAPVVGVVGAAVAQASASGGNQNSQVTAIGAARGPQSGAARGKAPEVATPRSDRMLRFERAFEAQVGRGLAQALRTGSGEVTLRLRPENLGQLSVRVQVRDSRVTATFEARSVEAVRLLEGSRDALRQQLEARGLSVERIDVRVVEDDSQVGTRLAGADHGGADGGQDGREFAGDRNGRGSPGGDGTEDGSRRGATREDDEPAVGAEPWRAMGTVRLDATA